MFVASCFIRKNTPELRKKLEELGYKYHGRDTESWGASALYCFDGKYYEVYPAKPSRYHSIVDCGTNEELFLALAALRDDTNKNQWFIAQGTIWVKDYNGKIITYYDEGELFLWNEYLFIEDNPSDFRKATVEEIIEHFK